MHKLYELRWYRGINSSLTCKVFILEVIDIQIIIRFIMIFIMSFLITFIFYSVMFTIISHRKSVTLHRKVHVPIQWKLVILGGFAMAASTVTYRLGLIDMQISYASALRQLSSLFGVLMGIFFLKESYGKQRIIGSIVIIAGIMLIRLNLFS